MDDTNKPDNDADNPDDLIAADEDPSREGTMTYWLAMAAKEARVTKGRKPRHIAHRLDCDQSTISRFESNATVPNNLDLFIAAYAEDTGTTSTEIWWQALRLWIKFGRESTFDQLFSDEDDERRAAAMEQDLAAARQARIAELAAMEGHLAAVRQASIAELAATEKELAIAREARIAELAAMEDAARQVRIDEQELDEGKPIT